MTTLKRLLHNLPGPFFPVLVPALLTALLTAGCGTAPSSARDGFFFDTVVRIRVNSKDADDILDQCFRRMGEYELIFSTENKNSELYRVNHRTEQTLTISDDLAACLSQSLDYCELTSGRFDVTICPVSELWDFHAEEPAVPPEERLRDALSRVDYRTVHLSGNTLSFDSPDTMIDLGAAAKGYISRELAKLIGDLGCGSALISLGGNVRAVGRKSAGKSWNVGIQKPFSARGELIGTVSAEDCCVISSGTYERCFVSGGKLYHHVLDTSTGYPCDTWTDQVTVIGEDDCLCDIIATVSLIIGREETGKLLRESGADVSLFYVDGDGNYTALDMDGT